jgi:hypothetical protein
VIHRLAPALLSVGLILLGAQALAAPSPPPTALAEPSGNDYGDPAAWLCRPDIANNACDVDLTATVVAADGTTRVEPFKGDPKAPIDCFYVYPTVSLDPGILATMKAERAERNVVKQQFARLGSVCRLYAPLYRQYTLTALAAAMSGHPLPGSMGPRPRTPFNDVRDAWEWYLDHDNHGRGVVLIGHSQGSGLLIELIKTRIDAKPEQARLVSTILMGANLLVPEGKDVGGDFKTIPLCHGEGQTGCAIAFASFRETSPPPENSLFGRPRTPAPGMAAACVNPAALGGGPGALKAYFPDSTGAIAPSEQPKIDWDKGHAVETPFVAVPGLLTATCADTPAFHYLSIHVNADPAGPRTSAIPGDVIIGGKIQTNWGLHLIDANLTMGNLVDIVRQEGAAWSAGHP